MGCLSGVLSESLPALPAGEGGYGSGYGIGNGGGYGCCCGKPWGTGSGTLGKKRNRGEWSRGEGLTGFVAFPQNTPIASRASLVAFEAGVGPKWSKRPPRPRTPVLGASRGVSGGFSGRFARSAVNSPRNAVGADRSWWGNPVAGCPPTLWEAVNESGGRERWRSPHWRRTFLNGGGNGGQGSPGWRRGSRKVGAPKAGLPPLGSERRWSRGETDDRVPPG